MNSIELTGRAETHLTQWSEGIRIHSEVYEPLTTLRNAAAEAGFGLGVCSGFRGFETQLKIWNAKVRGERPVLDDSGSAIDLRYLKPREKIWKILRWSALPGASRHHWGTDLDIYDVSQMPSTYKIQLVSSEYERGGIFGELSEWLDGNMEKFGFYRPYSEDQGGVNPERWHLSYGLLSQKFLRDLNESILRECLEHSAIDLKAEVLSLLPEIYKTFIVNVTSWPG